MWKIGNGRFFSENLSFSKSESESEKVERFTRSTFLFLIKKPYRIKNI
jgi:hypothetical protein